MTYGEQLSIHKPSFWKSRREVHDASGATLGYIEMKGWTYQKAEGEARGRRLLFSYDGWDSRYNYMTDMSGQKLASMEPIGWWGTQYKLRYGNTDYGWKPNMWGTAYTLSQGDAEILTVHRGGYFNTGSISVHRPMEEKDLLSLVLFTLYNMQQYESHSASAGAGVVVVANSN